MVREVAEVVYICDRGHRHKDREVAEACDARTREKAARVLVADCKRAARKDARAKRVATLPPKGTSERSRNKAIKFIAALGGPDKASALSEADFLRLGAGRRVLGAAKEVLAESGLHFTGHLSRDEWSRVLSAFMARVVIRKGFLFIGPSGKGGGAHLGNGPPNLTETDED